MSLMRFLINSFLILTLAFSTFAEDGECHLYTSPDGHFYIECEGSGIIYQTVTVEEIVYTYGNCQALKEDFQAQISIILNNLSHVDESLAYASQDVGNLRQEISYIPFIPGSPSQDLIDSLYSTCSSIDSNLDSAKSSSRSVASGLTSLSSSIASINCDSCPTQPGGGSSGGVTTNGQTCCGVDFTEILSRLDQAEATRKLIKQKSDSSFSALVNISNSLHTLEFLLAQGFGNTTNELIQISHLIGAFTNLTFSGWNKLGSSPVYRQFFYMPKYSASSSLNDPIPYNMYSAPLSYFEDPSHGFQNSFFAQGVVSSRALASLNNYFYDFRQVQFPSFTNLVSGFYSSSTNHFSFFRDQVGVSSVLSDYYSAQNSQYSDLTYYDYLTNHYVQVSVGGTLSGDQATKTNWFSRIETLLAALVFSDSVNTTNTVNGSDASQNSERVTEGLSALNQDAQSTADSLRQSSQSVISLYTQYCDIFDDASLPSRVVVFELSNDDHDVVSFEMSDSGRFSTLVDVCRAVTTFCWASVGIFLLFKFLVWASRCVFIACKFVYLVISKTFK